MLLRFYVRNDAKLAPTPTGGLISPPVGVGAYVSEEELSFELSHEIMALASMGSIYVAFHEVIGIAPPADVVDNSARVAIMMNIVAPAVETAYAEVYDDECEEKTPTERAEDYFLSFMQMDPKTWWEQELIFPEAAVKKHQRLFDLLPEDKPAYPGATAPAPAEA